MGEQANQVVRVPVIDADEKNIASCGQLIGDLKESQIPIPFYKGRVLEGQNIDFKYHGKAVIRTAKILPGYPVVQWLERHMRMSQLFLGLGNEPFIMVLAPPTHAKGSKLPDIAEVKAFRVPAGHVLLIHEGTWHDFPIACERPVVVLTANSDEVVTALIEMKTAGEMDQGDVFKISLPQRLGCEIQLVV